MKFGFKEKQSLLVGDKFLLLGILYASLALVVLFILAFIWLPPGYTIAGHDSGLPLDAKQFLATRLLAWDDRLGFGLDNSANFGSLTIHFFDFLAATLGGTVYAGNFVSVFFWLGLIFVSAFIFAYQLKDILGKPFVFILPILLVFNFYIFQSVFMLERAKFGIFSAVLISLAFIFRMQQKKSSVLTAAIVSSLAFSIFNGGGWFGVTLYGGVVIILATIIFTKFIEFRKTLSFFVLTFLLFLLLNAYSILPYVQNFLSNDVPRLVQETSVEGHKDWLNYVSRSTSFINLFRSLGIPDWYGEPSDFGKVNPSHPFASLYLNNNFLVLASGIFPLLAFLGLLLAKTREQRKILGFFGFIALFELIFAAGSHSPFRILYEFLMDNVPGFFLLRSAFYKFGVFYLLGMLVLFSFTLSSLIEKLSVFLGGVFSSQHWVKITVISLCSFGAVGLWFSYHWVLLDSSKVFAWKVDQSTKVKVPQYVFDFASWAGENKLDKRIVMVPPVNKDWQNDAYSWGYWSLSPLPFALSSAKVLSNWHGLTSTQLGLVDSLYGAIRANDEKNFLNLASSLDAGYILLREDVLIRSNWSSTERPESYKLALESFKSVRKIAKFGNWTFYEIERVTPGQVYAVSSVNLISDNFVPLLNKYFNDGHAVGFSAKKEYPGIEQVSANKAYAVDCLSCVLETQTKIRSLPSTVIKPGSPLYYFKQRREREILGQNKDLNSKIADYLGFVLIRSAELRQMVDTNISERILLESMVTIRLYLAQLHSKIGSVPRNLVDFVMLRQVLEYLNPVEREISDYMRGSASKQRSHQFGEEMLGIVWDIQRVKELFSPILENPDRWETEKVYRISFAQPGEYKLIFSAEAFSHTIDDKVILPKLAKFTIDGKEEVLEIKNEGEDWLASELGFRGEGTGELRLYFDEAPNLFNIESSGFEKFFFGKVSCLNGPIKNFNKGRAYNVMVSKTDRFKKIQVIFKDKDKIYSEKHGFLKGEDLFDVESIPQGQLARYLYFPSATAKNIYIYICSDDATPPPVDRVVVREFFIPSLVNIKKSNAGAKISPDVYYKRINPTEYEVVTRDVLEPFVLFFNDNFNSSWQLKEVNGNKAKVVNEHFMIDGYANAWLVNKTDTGKFKIVYKPQSMFYAGSLISLSTMSASIIWLIYSWIRDKLALRDKRKGI